MGVNISARFGKNDELYNGLNHIEEALLAEPNELRTAVVRYRTKFAKQDFEHGGAATPTVKIVQFEPVDGGDAVDILAMAAKAYKARTGGELQPELFDDPDEDQADDATPEPATAGRRRK